MESLTNVGAITMFIADVAKSKAFYATVFALDPIYEDENAVAFKFENTVVNLLRTSEAGDLIGPARVAAASSGSRFQLTIWVENATQVCADLVAAGVTLNNGPIDRPWGMRTASFADPDGHIWEVAENIKGA